MLELLVLGQIPGTSIHMSFFNTSLLVLLGLCCYMLASLHFHATKNHIYHLYEYQSSSWLGSID